MKRYFLFSTLLIIFGMPSIGMTGWELYDDFNSGSSIDTSKWEIDDSSANITIEKGQVKFEHLSGHALDTSRLTVKINPENVFGIRAKVKMMSYTGDISARIGGYIGKFGNDYAWSAIRLRAINEIIQSYIVAEQNDSFQYLFTWFSHNFYPRADFLNQTFDITWKYTEKNLQLAVDGTGKIGFNFPETLPQADITNKGISTRSNDSAGSCIVYFDDVYIYRKN